MNKNGEVIIIEDNQDDQFLFETVFDTLDYPNKRVYFKDGEAALEYLHKPGVIPFLILSDINLPKLTGLELREKLKTDEDLNLKCIPYLFFSSEANQQMVMDAYSLSAQGFFVKPKAIVELTDVIRSMMNYWGRCAAPNNFR
ncbi:response regulator [Dyadobacter sp. CY326]|uniref:response regulator n=1 Tax=Dyadobacter sp. CY326 TaxID=2907300 RepID=UPI001F2F0917|nr:response regulator [Dyadobacter sp. CY326]MCE7064019.1 response regulator [Dyadobacter sp. CY326]